VGSKGKGTAATFASATLVAAGLRVGTVTSPGFRSNRERIRVDGRAIDVADYAALISRMMPALHDATRSLPPGGYLAPTGLFTLMGIRHFIDAGCDAWVLEAGMGGGSDEVSLFTADVLALTPVFDEHLGVIADTVTGIAVDKLGAASPATRTLVSAKQPDAEAAAVLQQWRGTHGDVQVAMIDAPPFDGMGWPGGLAAANAWVGVSAALSLLRIQGRQSPDAARLRDVLATVRLPARLSTHARGAQRWVVDAGANPAAAAAALRWCEAHNLVPDTVLVCIPDGKRIDATLETLRGHHVIPLRSDAPHLQFSQWPGMLPSLAEADVDILGEVVLALGTISFAGEVLELLGVDTETAFELSPG